MASRDLKHFSPSRSIKKIMQGEMDTQKKVEKRAQSKILENKEKSKNLSLHNQLQVRSTECQNLKAQVVRLPKDLTKKASRNKKERSTNTAPSKQTENCMTDIIIEKTRMLKNQELQIEALTQQVGSLKEVINITKDMLEIRNIEVKQLNDKLQYMESKFSKEKDQHETVHSKLERMMTLNDELRAEYKKQLCIFNELQNSYHEHMANCKTLPKLAAINIKSNNDKFENQTAAIKVNTVEATPVAKSLPENEVQETAKKQPQNEDLNVVQSETDFVEGLSEQLDPPLVVMPSEVSNPPSNIIEAKECDENICNETTNGKKVNFNDELSKGDDKILY